MSARVSPIERIRAEIDDLLGSERDLGEVLAEVARLGVRLAMRTAIEAEVTELLGRERDGRGERIRSRRRNGHCPTTVEPTAGPVGLDRPKLRGSDEAFASRLVGVGVYCTNHLEPPAFVPGLVGPRCRGQLGRPVGRGGGAVEVDRQSGMRADQGRARHLEGPGSLRRALGYRFSDGSHF